MAGQLGVPYRRAQPTDELARAAQMPAVSFTGSNGCIRRSGRVVREVARAGEKVHRYVTGSRLWAGSNRMSEILRRPTTGPVVSNHTAAIRFDESRSTGIAQFANRLGAAVSHATNSGIATKSVEARSGRPRLEAHCSPPHGNVARQRREHPRSPFETTRQRRQSLVGNRIPFRDWQWKRNARRRN